MHIQFTKIRYKNILSVGNSFIEIHLDRNKTSLISGSNGAGKSVLLEALVYALFAKPFRKINRPQLVNSINGKELLIELFFTIGSDRYLIRRGMKPTIFEIWKNDELLNKDAASRDYQQYLEQNIIKMSFKSFTQIVILGSATYVPFMELPTGQRREIIEDLLDIQVFSTMNNLLKERITENKANITENNYQIDLVNTKLDSAKKHNAEIQKIKLTEVEKIKTKVKENLDHIELEKKQTEDYELKITELSSTITDKAKQKKLYEKVKTLLYDLETKERDYKKEIEFYSKHDNCPTCKQGIDHDFKTEIVEERSSKTNELKEGLLQLQQKKEEVETRLSEISDTEDEIQKFHNKANEHRLKIKMIMNQLSAAKKELEGAEREVEEIDQSKIQDLISELKTKQDEQTALYEKRETLGIVAAMLKDGGIKTSIIRTYIPIINKIINQYLSEFELFVDFNLDETFNETIKSRFRDTFSFASFSEGEKMRINLSIMFTWRAVAKLRNSISTNILVMDEIMDSGSDQAGVDALIEILGRTHTNDNIFVISHREMMGDKFENHIRFEKVKNFTQLAA
jgi:DNA repair exonuclease SbcCD ATPase subunit